MNVALLLIFVPLVSIRAEEDTVDLTNTAVWEQRGWYKRELSLIKPYQSSGTENFWDISGSTMITSNFIRLTPDVQSRQGAVWNRMPVFTRDWEVHLTFKVHGSTGEMFGDGMGFWYAKQRSQLGNVFGSTDQFKGLGIFFDTYSNHNGPHSHGHPWISAMVNNGSLAYDHDRDGTHTQLGGEDAGCEARFRNKDFDANLLVRYVADTLSIYTDINNKGVWEKCMSVPGVRLPTGYFLGMSATTGDLSDNHDIIAVRFYEQDYARAEVEADADRSQIEPSAVHLSAPRDHVDAPRPSQLGWVGTIVLVVVAVGVCVVALGFGVTFLQNRQMQSRKRFY